LILLRLFPAHPGAGRAKHGTWWAPRTKMGEEKRESCRIAREGGEQEEKSDYTGPHRESAGSDGRSHARIDDRVRIGDVLETA
jgi:hypothetical protein